MNRSLCSRESGLSLQDFSALVWVAHGLQPLRGIAALAGLPMGHNLLTSVYSWGQIVIHILEAKFTSAIFSKTGMLETDLKTYQTHFGFRHGYIGRKISKIHSQLYLNNFIFYEAHASRFGEKEQKVIFTQL